MKRSVLCLVLLLALVSSAAASPIILSGSPTLTAWGVADLSGGPFWANTSLDGNGIAHVGYFLSGTPGSSVPNFYANSPGEFMPYVGDGTTTFNWFLAPNMAVSSLLSVTAWSDTFSLQPTATPNVYTLQLQTPYHTWRSDTLDGGRNHFAVFQGSDAWYVGMEDMTWSQRADWDYNDLVVRLPDPSPVPEPGSTLTMLGVGMLAIARKMRRR
jgi:hypothetical protein